MGCRPNFLTIEVTDKIMLIRDVGPWDKHKTITNGAEEVCEELLYQLKGRKLFYIESEGELDQLLIENGKFVGFGSNASGWPPIVKHMIKPVCVICKEPWDENHDCYCTGISKDFPEPKKIPAPPSIPPPKLYPLIPPAIDESGEKFLTISLEVKRILNFIEIKDMAYVEQYGNSEYKDASYRTRALENRYHMLKVAVIDLLKALGA